MAISCSSEAMTVTRIDAMHAFFTIQFSEFLEVNNLCVHINLADFIHHLYETQDVKALSHI